MPDVTPFTSGSVRGFLHRPVGSLSGGLALTHGAGGNCESPLLVALATAFAAAGICVLRFNLPFRERKRFGPPLPATAAEDREALRAAAAELRSLVSAPVYIAGHSYGGRQASMLAAENPRVADRLLFLSYPLHPPNKPTQLRTSHFAALRTQALFVHGTKDPFGSPEELAAALALIPAPTRMVPIENAAHDLRKGKFDIANLVVKPFLTNCGDPA